MNMGSHHPHRRQVLQALGLGAFASAFVPVLDAEGQEALFPKRLVLFYTPHGTIYENWKPSGTTTSFTLGRILTPLAPFQRKINVLDGLQITHSAVRAPSHTEGIGLAWTGSNLSSGSAFNFQGYPFDWVDGPSVDQVIAKNLGSGPPFPSLELGVNSGSNAPNNRMIYAGARQPVQPETSPQKAFNRLFANVAGGQTPNPATDRLRAEKKSVLDLVTAQLARVRPSVSTADQLKIDAHTNAIREIETRLGASAPAVSCTKPVAPTNANDVPGLVTGQLDILAAALACNQTRVASLQLKVGDNDNNPYPWLGVNDAHHPLSHSGDNDMVAKEKLTKIYTWYADRFAYFLGKLDAIPEGNGTLLDNTLVVWSSEVGKGNNHSFSKLPVVLAGGLGGKVATGRYLQYSNVAHNRLLVAICHAMGLDQVQKFGSTDQGTGSLEGFA
jgi:hypothetical protein